MKALKVLLFAAVVLGAVSLCGCGLIKLKPLSSAPVAHSLHANTP